MQQYNIKKYFLGIYSLLFCLCLWACSQPLPYGDLRIRVTASDTPLSGAEVTIYKTREDFNKEQNPYRGPELTDGQGSVSFFGLEDTVYYVNVAKETLNNWESSQIRRSIIITENGFNNAQSYDIRITASSLLAAPQGKVWQLDAVVLNGTDITAQYPECEKDDVLTFFKGGAYLKDEGQEICQSGTPQSSTGTWRFQNLNAKLLIESESGLVMDWNILSLTSNTLQVAYSTRYQGNDVLLHLYFVAL